MALSGAALTSAEISGVNDRIGVRTAPPPNMKPESIRLRYQNRNAAGVTAAFIVTHSTAGTTALSNENCQDEEDQGGE